MTTVESCPETLKGSIFRQNACSNESLGRFFIWSSKEVTSESSLSHLQLNGIVCTLFVNKGSLTIFLRFSYQKDTQRQMPHYPCGLIRHNYCIYHKKKCTRERWWEGTREWEGEHKDVEGESGGDGWGSEGGKGIENPGRKRVGSSLAAESTLGFSMENNTQHIKSIK